MTLPLKDETIGVRVSSMQKADIERAAELAEMSPAAWMRMIALLEARKAIQAHEDKERTR